MFLVKLVHDCYNVGTCLFKHMYIYMVNTLITSISIHSMNYLKQLEQNLNSDSVIIRDSYVDQSSSKTPREDVVTDLIEHHQLVTIARLPIARQIVTSDHKINFKIPRIGDSLIGIVHHQVIKSVTFTFTNYSEEFTIEGQLKNNEKLSFWTVTTMPIMLCVIDDYDNIYISVQIETNQRYNLQLSNQDSFKAYYGYFNQSIKQQIVNQTIYEIPLINPHHSLRTVCGIWTIVESNRDENETDSILPDSRSRSGEDGS
jgi:hypothetical protein